MFGGGLAVLILPAARYVILLMLLGGSTPVIVGVFKLKEPKEIWVNDPPAAMSVDGVSPAVIATILCTTMLVYLLVSDPRLRRVHGQRGADARDPLHQVADARARQRSRR